MSKPIKLTEELKKQALAEFEKTLAGLKMSDGKISYNKNFTYKDDDKAVIVFTPLAYTKMLSLLMSFDSEVAWHGVGRRIEGAQFLISDILVYPQTVTGSTVEMDTEAYAMWLMENDEDDRFNNIVMQGHSHVTFGTTPSSVDTKHQDEILAQLTDDMYYIFMIWNKKLEHTTKIYDLANNTLYENGDISYAVADENYELEEFVKEANAQVKKKVTTPAYGGNYGGGYNYGSGYNYGGKTPAQQNNTQQNNNQKSKQKQKGKAEVGSGWNGRGSDDMDDYAYNYYNRT